MRSETEVERSETKDEGHKDVSQKSYHRNGEMMVDKGEPRETEKLAKRNRKRRNRAEEEERDSHSQLVR